MVVVVGEARGRKAVELLRRFGWGRMVVDGPRLTFPIFPEGRGGAVEALRGGSGASKWAEWLRWRERAARRKARERAAERAARAREILGRGPLDRRAR